MKLINDWKQAWKLKSVQVGAISAFFYVLMYAAFELLWLFGSNFPQFWAAVPQEIKELLPHSWVLWLGFLNNVLSVFARLKAQPELHEPLLDEFSIQPLAKIPTNDLAWMVEAKKHIGLRENTSKTAHNPVILKWLKSLGAWWAEDETPWCGVFVAHCLRIAGVKYPKHWYRALDYVNYGTKLTKPAYGCVAIKTRKGGGHVCFVVGRDSKTGKLVCLGGNQGNAVSYALYAESEFQEFRWYGMTSQPASHRYNLPIMQGVTATQVSEA